jgi:hypothetical protein
MDEYLGRLIVARWNGDVIAGDAKDGEFRGYHLRDFDLETKAPCEALRCHLAGEEPPKAAWLVFRTGEESFRNATKWEREQHFRWRVWEVWTAMRPLMEAHRKSQKRSRAKRNGKGARR